MKQTGFSEKIDAYFEGKSSTERFAIMLIPALIVAYITWAILSPPAEAMRTKSIADKKAIQKKIREDQKYFENITRNGDRDYQVKEFDKKIALSKKRADNYRTKITILDNNLYKLSDVLFNQKNWSLFLDSITSRAHENGLEIKTITNDYVDSNGSFGHVLEIGVRCRGTFSGIVKFMNDIERKTLVTDIFQSNIYTDENSTLVNADINISVWGVSR